MKKQWMLVLLVLFALWVPSSPGHVVHAHEEDIDALAYDPNRPEYYTPEFKAVAEQLHSQDSCSSLYACPSGPLARTAKDTIVKMLNEGKSTDEILDYFVDNYGESILLAPRGTGLGSFSTYAVPFVIIFVVGIVIFTAVRLWVKKSGFKQAKEEDFRLAVDETESDVIRQMIEDERKKFL